MRLATEESAAGLIAEAQAAAEVKDADEGREFGRGKRPRYAGTSAGPTIGGKWSSTQLQQPSDVCCASLLCLQDRACCREQGVSVVTSVPKQAGPRAQPPEEAVQHGKPPLPPPKRRYACLVALSVH